MSPISNPSIIFNELPKGEPTLETLKIDESAQIDLEEELKDNEIILKLVCVSLDPYMRGRMREEHIKSYSPAFPLNKPWVVVLNARMSDRLGKCLFGSSALQYRRTWSCQGRQEQV
jgi:NADPH-dependent curcumin reductase CurA